MSQPDHPFPRRGTYQWNECSMLDVNNPVVVCPNLLLFCTVVYDFDRQFRVGLSIRVQNLNIKICLLSHSSKPLTRTSGLA